MLRFDCKTIEKTYDMRYLYPVFPQFEVFKKDKELFNQVRIGVGGYGISWNDDPDLDTEDIWEDRIETGIYQTDISKIERGLANPSLSTLKRLAEGMGLKLKIEFDT